MAENIPLIYDIDSYRFNLPPERIAQQPAVNRDRSRLLALNPATGAVSDLHFTDIVDFFSPHDLLVVNNTRVFPARLLGRKESGGKVELLILHYPQETLPAADKHGQVAVTGLLKSSKGCRPGQRIIFADELTAEVVELYAAGKARLQLHFQGELAPLLDKYGQLPLPPYIRREQGEEPQDRERYQTVFAAATGAIAAPTAGLHFTDELLSAIARKGVERESVTLHVGYGTFAPVRVQDIRQHRIHSEFLTVSAGTAAKINEVRDRGGRLWAVGTTTVRALEFAADDAGRVQAREGWCDLYIYPGYQFKVVRNLITNFHLPGSSLLFMVSALAGRERVLAAYAHAVARGYRFFSYGDAMILVGG
ncbi:MAG: tRNA preQ1(34) S-adenosylmethionine ribosyltransferase-isomerase QueA [Desulfurivibrio sp.]|jgi:S-adenosylmethionine:tRNA ribosyltransferase-isomerase|nr:MAG: tRNA preQ1(34) S-adenosylmethionine ribosyltransferase-isomerase QueA [Desulfurivibrio sp.]